MALDVGCGGVWDRAATPAPGHEAKQPVQHQHLLPRKGWQPELPKCGAYIWKQLFWQGCNDWISSSQPTMNYTRSMVQKVRELRDVCGPHSHNRLMKHCQRHNGPEGWVHFSKVTYWVTRKFKHISWSNFIFRISTKHQLQNLNQTSTSP